MSNGKWEEWAGQALKGPHLREPPEHLLRRVERSAFGKQTEPAPVRTAAWPGWMRGLAAASIVGLAVIGTVVLRDGGPSLPERGIESTVRGSLVQLVSPTGEIPETPSSFVWRVFEGATSYRVSVLAVDDEVLWESVVAAESIELPEPTRDRLRSAVVYRWRVEALDADGSVVGRSETTRFRIKP
jgi:hypothetical protein